MIYNANNRQSINKANQEFKVLTVLQDKSLLHCSAYVSYWSCLVNFTTLQDSLRLLYVLCKSSSSNWMNLIPKFKVFIRKLLVCFIMGTTSLLGTMSLLGTPSLLGTTSITGDNVTYWGQCTFLGTMSL